MSRRRQFVDVHYTLEPGLDVRSVTDGRPVPMFFGGLEPEDGWERDVWLVARRLALLHYYMARVLVERLGEERGRELVGDIIRQYGEHCGRDVGRVVDQHGCPRDLSAYEKCTDLPSRGWHRESAADGPVITLCPLAETWKLLGGEDLGRLYCWVDQAKLEAYNREFTCDHKSNVLDGDPVCKIASRAAGKDSDQP